MYCINQESECINTSRRRSIDVFNMSISKKLNETYFVKYSNHIILLMSVHNCCIELKKLINYIKTFGFVCYQ
jgi:hypothetical protein